MNIEDIKILILTILVCGLVVLFTVVPVYNNDKQTRSTPHDTIVEYENETCKVWQRYTKLGFQADVLVCETK